MRFPFSDVAKLVSNSSVHKPGQPSQEQLASPINVKNVLRREKQSSRRGAKNLEVNGAT